ncbi:MAG: 4Fe-4S binding protein [Oryzomonas sp.]|uniref:4Fe-4S binding protein n=1 Tax=Oryzomonas sp. TaxID=2855186 RepID=UPI0028508A95|nr:4Fe-4S binding protein [Oryzomonas sp.]MDR3578650.1 4Fe-4S binding protein [Oryzomonas sp.]
METARSGPLLDFPSSVPHVDVNRCSGCGRCVAACLSRLVTLDRQGYRKVARIMSAERCTRCGACVGSCPIGALSGH